MRFVVLGDLHYTFYSEPALTQGRELFYDSLLTEITDLQPDLVFSIGDAVNNGRIQEYESLLSLVKKRGLRDRFIIVPGNHDVLKTTKRAAHFFLQPPARLFADYAVPATAYYAFDYDQTRFVVLDTPLEMNDDDWGGRVDTEQLNWLQNEISCFNQHSDRRLLVVLAHHPLRDTTFRSEKFMMNIHNSEEVWSRLAELKQGPGLYFNGHNHTVSLALRDNWYFVQAGAPYRCADYRVCEVETGAAGGKLSVRISTRNINNGAESSVALANQLGDALEHFNHFEQPKGTASDRHLMFTK